MEDGETGTSRIYLPGLADSDLDIFVQHAVPLAWRVMMPADERDCPV
jgi:hypothetical protein